MSPATVKYRAHCFSCRKPVTLSKYKVVSKVVKQRKFRYALGACPKCGGKVCRMLGSGAPKSPKSKETNRPKRKPKKTKRA